VVEAPPAEDSFEDSPKSRPRATAKSSEDYDEARPRREKRSRQFDDEDDEDRPRSRRQHQDDEPAKKNKGLVIGLCVGLAVLVIGGGVLAFFLIGRGPAVDSRTEMDMKMIGLAYHSHLDALRKPPARAEDLLPYLGESPTAFKRLKDAQVIFFWNVGIKDMTAGSSNTILAYERDTSVKGGLTLFGDGSVRVLSLNDFQKTAKATRRIPVNPPPVGSAWKEFASKSGTYTILLPGNASPKEDALFTKDGLPVFTVRARMPDQSLYQVILTQLPAKFIADNPRAALLQQFSDAIIKKVGGQNIDEGNMQVANEPAVHANFKVPGPGKGYARVFIVKNSLYQMLVLGPENSPYGKDAGKFFDSFKLRSKDKGANNEESKISDPADARARAKLAQQYVNAKKYREAALMFEKTAPPRPENEGLAPQGSGSLLAQGAGQGKSPRRRQSGHCRRPREAEPVAYALLAPWLGRTLSKDRPVSSSHRAPRKSHPEHQHRELYQGLPEIAG
jgi:hypothetical protein